MKRLFFVFCALLTVSLTGCNGVGNKDTLIARIGSENVYQEDLNLAFNPELGDFSSEKNMDAYGNLFDETAFVGRILQENPQYEEQWKSYSPLMEKRVLALVYQNIFIKQSLGYTEEELRDFFDKKKDDFDGADYLAVRSKVAEQYYLYKAKDSLETFIRNSLHNYDVPEEVHIAVFESDSAWAVSMADTLNMGIPLDSLHDLHSAHVSKGREKGFLRDSIFIRAFFSADSMRVGEARMFALDRDSTIEYFAIKIVTRTPFAEANLEEVRPTIERNFIEKRRNFLVEDLYAQLRENKDFVAEVVAPENPQKFYEDHKNHFRTVPGFELYHIGMADSMVLDSIRSQGLLQNLDSFKNVALSRSEVKETAEKGGFIGKVKVDYALPYGIGMMPELFKELAGKAEEYVSGIYRSSNDGLFHVFYVSAVIPSEVKPYERAKSGIPAVYTRDFRAVDSSAVIISRKGKPLFLESDVRRLLQEEMGKEDSDQNTHNRMVAMMLGSSIGAEMAQKKKVDHSWYYKASLRGARRAFILKHYKADLSTKSAQVPDSSYVKYLDNLLQFDFVIGGEAVCPGKDLASCRGELVNKYSANYGMNYVRMKQLESWNKVRSSFFDPQWETMCPKTIPQDILDKAAESRKSGNFEKSVKLYEIVLRTFAGEDSVFQKTMLELAQAYADVGRYDESEKNYEAFYTIWPEHPEAEKAMFSRGFVLNENLHKDKEALRVLEAFCKKYPKSELKESAEWLMADIKSSGKLADDLMKKIDAEGN